MPCVFASSGGANGGAEGPGLEPPYHHGSHGSPRGKKNVQEGRRKGEPSPVLGDP
jgi:hypothetical protein